jgi:hypothetical protein
MRGEKALYACTFSWGKKCLVYHDFLEVDGMSYDLNDLTSVYPTYRRLFGIASARLELYFGRRRLVLRGIADPAVARQIVSYLLPYCSEILSSDTPSRRLHSYGSQSKQLVRAQARAWERTSKVPAIPHSPENVALRHRSTHLGEEELTLHHRSTALDEEGVALRHRSADLDEAELFSDEDLLSLEPHTASFTEAEISQSEEEASQSTRPSAPLTPKELTKQDSRSLIVCQSSPALFTAGLQLLHVPRIQPPLRSVHLVDPEQKMIDTCSVPVPALKTSVLPVIHVPVRLEPGECAHYSIGATLCSDRLSNTSHSPYAPLDHGLLILTNRRVYFIGERSQLSLPYLYLWYVSLFYNALALHIERQFRRIIIEVDHPQEWASRIEQIAFIARRSQNRASGSALSHQLLPGLKSSPGEFITMKRGALKVPPKRPTIELETQAASLHEHNKQKIIEAKTVSFDEQTKQHKAGETYDLASASIEAETIELPSQSAQALVESETIELFRQIIPELTEAETISLPRQQTQNIEECETINLPRQQTQNIEESETISLPRLSAEECEDTDVVLPRKRKRGAAMRAVVEAKRTSTSLIDDQTMPRRAQRGNLAGRVSRLQKRDDPTQLEHSLD